MGIKPKDLSSTDVCDLCDSDKDKKNEPILDTEELIIPDYDKSLQHGEELNKPIEKEENLEYLQTLEKIDNDTVPSQKPVEIPTPDSSLEHIEQKDHKLNTNTTIKKTKNFKDE